MSENYIMLNGKRVDLTDDQIKKLGLNVDKNIFKRNDEKEFFFITSTGLVLSSEETIADKEFPNLAYNVANYCTDKSLMEQRALHETLSRLLWRFSMQNDGDKINWNNSSYKCFITYDYRAEEFQVDYYAHGCTLKANTQYFYSVDIAKRAINEIIIPFMKEHPEFVW